VAVRKTKQLLRTKSMKELENQDADDTNQPEGLEPHLFCFSSSASLASLSGFGATLRWHT
jgi:hypothetical protein